MYAFHARDAWLRAAKLDPRDLDFRQYLAEFYLIAPRLMGGDPARAQRYVAAVGMLSPYRGDLLAAIQMNPSDAAAKDALARLTKR